MTARRGVYLSMHLLGHAEGPIGQPGSAMGCLSRPYSLSCPPNVGRSGRTGSGAAPGAGAYHISHVQGHYVGYSPITGIGV